MNTIATASYNYERYGLGVEYQTPIDGLSLFASLATGQHDYNHAFIGPRFYFGGRHKSLIRRRREDDPANHLLQNVIDTFVTFPRAFGASGMTGGGGAGQL